MTIRIRRWSLLVAVSTCGNLRADTQILKEPLLRGVVIPEVTSDDALGADVSGIDDFDGDGSMTSPSPGNAVVEAPKSSACSWSWGAQFPPVRPRVKNSNDPRTKQERALASRFWAGTLIAMGTPMCSSIKQTSPGSTPDSTSSVGAQLHRRSTRMVGVSIRRAVLEASPSRGTLRAVVAVRDFNGDGTWDLAFSTEVGGSMRGRCPSSLGKRPTGSGRRC
jgi:hypothetical protein